MHKAFSETGYQGLNKGVPHTSVYGAWMTEQPLRNHQTQDHGDGEDGQVSGGRHIHELQDRDAHRPHHTKHHGQGAADDGIWNQR